MAISQALHGADGIALREALSSVGDAEATQSTVGRQDLYVQPIDLRQRWAFPGPLNESINLQSRTFRYKLHIAIGQIPDISVYTELPGLFTSGCPEPYALNSTRDPNPNLLHRIDLD